MKTYFNSITFYWILLSSISLLLVINLLTFVITLNPIALLPILIQSLLLFLIFTKHKYAKIGVKIWTIIFLIIANGLQLLGIILQVVGGENPNKTILDFVGLIILILIGVAILVFTNKTVESK